MFSALRRFALSVPLSLLLWSGASLATAAESATPAAAPVIKHPRLGVCTHLRRWKNEAIIPLLANSGVTYIRDDYYWKAIETKKGVYALPEDYRKWLDAAHAAGLKVIAIFDQENSLYAPDIYSVEAYVKAVTWFAKETAGKVQVIEILNEPFGNFGFRKHYGGTWNGVESDGGPSPWLGKYVELLNAAAPAIKAVNPDVKVIGLGSPPPANFRQLAMGLVPEVDGITDHPYSFRTAPEILPYASTEGILKRDGIATADERGSFASVIRNYRTLSEKHQGPKELWLTEWGWATFHEAKAGGFYAGFTESAQAKYILRRLFESEGLGVDVSVVYDFRDDGRDPYEPEHNFGLVTVDLKPKPSYRAVQRFAALMADYRPKKSFEVTVFTVENRPDTHPIVWDGSKLAAPGTVLTYQFANSQGAPLIALWSAERADGDITSRVADVEVEMKDPSFKEIRCHNVLTDTTATVPFERKGDRIMIKKMIIPDTPLTLTFH
ncbi:MAG: hypothetical protein ACAH89_15410 [Rariglobus sp.]|nr:hypothetical protein [Rariglobus sp.]